MDISLISNRESKIIVVEAPFPLPAGAEKA